MFRVPVLERKTAIGYKKAKTNRNWVQILHFYHAKTVNTRYTASVAFSSKYKRILANENTQRNSYESFLSKCLHLRDRLFFISPLLKFYYEHHLQVKHTKSKHTVDNIGHVRIQQNFTSLLRIDISFVHVCLDLY
jgi:hypothetical protein